jgi:hypothetical protein
MGGQEEDAPLCRRVANHPRQEEGVRDNDEDQAEPPPAAHGRQHPAAAERVKEALPVTLDSSVVERFSRSSRPAPSSGDVRHEVGVAMTSASALSSVMRFEVVRRRLKPSAIPVGRRVVVPVR